jgi:glycolate oxidase FAD binding subunit
MNKCWKPENTEQLLDAVQWAVNKDQSFNVRGRGSKQDFGRPVQTGQDLDISGLKGITAYEPRELFMTANAATPIAEIKAVLKQNNQQLAFEPPDLGVFFGSEVDGSIGGAIACNLAGPRRIQAGAARDHFLGFNAVSGRGEVFKSGGTVVKNVTGFDLSKLLAGSFGTLAVLSRVTFKVMPAAEKARTILCLGLDDCQAAKAMAVALGSFNEVTAAAHLPAQAASLSGVLYVSGVGAAVTAVRVEGPGISVEHRCKALRELLSKFGGTDELHSQNSSIFWREIGDVGALLGDGQVWRLSVPPMDGASVVKTILAATEAQVFYDWGGGLVWLALESSDVGEKIVRGAIKATGGHATLVRAKSSVRAKVPVFEPQSRVLSELTVRVKRGFDPKGVLNPGRLYEGV